MIASEPEKFKPQIQFYLFIRLGTLPRSLGLATRFQLIHFSLGKLNLNKKDKVQIRNCECTEFKVIYMYIYIYITLTTDDGNWASSATWIPND